MYNNFELRELTCDEILADIPPRKGKLLLQSKDVGMLLEYAKQWTWIRNKSYLFGGYFWHSGQRAKDGAYIGGLYVFIV